MTNRRLIIIDDEVDFCKFVSRVASAVGYDVEITTRGEDFMDAVLRTGPDVIIIDIIMPKMDGVELIKWLAERRSPARIIVVTGFNPYYAKMVQDLGAAQGLLSITTLVKPISISNLKAVLIDGETV